MLKHGTKSVWDEICVGRNLCETKSVWDEICLSQFSILSNSTQEAIATFEWRCCFFLVLSVLSVLLTGGRGDAQGLPGAVAEQRQCVQEHALLRVAHLRGAVPRGHQNDSPRR